MTQPDAKRVIRFVYSRVPKSKEPSSMTQPDAKRVIRFVYSRVPKSKEPSSAEDGSSVPPPPTDEDGDGATFEGRKRQEKPKGDYTLQEIYASLTPEEEEEVDEFLNGQRYQVQMVKAKCYFFL